MSNATSASLVDLLVAALTSMNQSQSAAAAPTSSPSISEFTGVSPLQGVLALIAYHLAKDAYAIILARFPKSSPVVTAVSADASADVVGLLEGHPPTVITLIKQLLELLSLTKQQTPTAPTTVSPSAAVLSLTAPQ